MKKSVLFLAFYLWGVYGAHAESLDVFFQDQMPAQKPASQDIPGEAVKDGDNSGSTVIKPQVLYLEDLNTPEKTEKPAAVLTPVVQKTKAPAGPAQTDPVALPPVVIPAKPTAGAAYDPEKIKKESLPKTMTKIPEAPAVVAATSVPEQPVAVQKSIIQDRDTQPKEQQNNLPESRQTLSSFQQQHQGQYAPFATQTSRQQAAHSLVTQAKNEGRTYPAGLDPFVIEFDQTFAVLSPNRAIRDLYKTATITPTLVQDTPSLSFKVIPTMPAAPAPVQAVTIPEKQSIVPTKADTAQQPEQTSSPTEATNTLVLEDAPAVKPHALHSVSDNTSAWGVSPLATVMVSETAQVLDPASQSLLDQVAAAYHDGSLSVIHITGYVNTRAAQGDDVRGYTHIQSLGRRGAALVVDYLKGKNVPESAMAYRIIPISTIALQNPFYDAVSTENTLRLDVAGGRS